VPVGSPAVSVQVEFEVSDHFRAVIKTNPGIPKVRSAEEFPPSRMTNLNPTPAVGREHRLIEVTLQPNFLQQSIR